MLNLKSFTRIALAALLVILLFRGFQALFQGEEGRVREFILQGKKALEAKDILTCTALVSDTYQDKYGNDRQSLLFATKNFFSYYQGIFIQIEEIEIELSEAKDQAEVNMVALILCKLEDNTADHLFEKEKGSFIARLVKEEKKWKLKEIEFLEEISVMGQRIS